MINHVSVAFSITPVFSLGQSSPAQPAPGQAIGGACDQGAQQFREEGAAQPSDAGFGGFASIDVVNGICFIIDVLCFFGIFWVTFWVT